MRIGSTLALVIAAGAIAAPAGASGADPYYERAFVSAAHDRCGLFEPTVAQALKVATLQARGAALRQGAGEAALAATAARATGRAAGVPCASADLATVAGRVRHAFHGWARTPRMVFPAMKSGWSVDRYRQPTGGWRLVQDSVVGASPVRVGALPDGQLTTVVSFVGRPRPIAARIVTRDAARDPKPWLSTPSPAAARRSVWASGSGGAPMESLASGRTQGEAWRFPVAGAEALAGLDPREVFLVEFLFRDDSVAVAPFEAGDFAAARAFAALGPV